MTFLRIFAALLVGSAAQAADLTVNITDLRSGDGQIMVFVVNTDAAWNNQARPVKAQMLAAQAGGVELVFKDLPAGSYAVQVVHDENGNSKLDMNAFGIPLEGYGFSNNPRVPGRPTFNDARFELGSDAQKVVVQLR